MTASVIRCEMPGCNRTPEHFGNMVCNAHFYPGVEDDIDRYRMLREEGYSYSQARLMAGLSDPAMEGEG